MAPAARAEIRVLCPQGKLLCRAQAQGDILEGPLLPGTKGTDTQQQLRTKSSG